MDHRPAPHRSSIRSLARVVRAFAEGALVAIGFASAILLIGIPVAFSIRYVHAGLSWLAAPASRMSALVEALISVSGVAAGAVAAVVLVKLVVGVLVWHLEAA